jgi:nucleoporin SEH1
MIKAGGWLGEKRSNIFKRHSLTRKTSPKMNISQEFLAGHDDLIHDIKFNFYGNRFVTCSSDHKLKVWDKAQSTTLNDSWKAHEAPVLRVSWAHPEFGQIIASASFDRTVRIWEEVDHENINSGRRWQEKCKLGHAKSTIQDVQFAPNHLGLKLACCSADGIMRIYEAMDPMNSSDWILSHVFELAQGAKEPEGQFCLSWCPSKLLPPMLVAGCGKENIAKIFRLDQNNTWSAYETLPGHNGLIRDVAWAPNMGR